MDAGEVPVRPLSDGRPRWAAVVVNHDAGAALGHCVDSILADESAGRPEVVVVDNASRDGSADELAERRPDVTVVRSATNLGYARAANLGIATTRAPFVAVCNPDLVVAAGTAAAMLSALERPGVVAVGPKTLDPDGSVYPSARRLPGVVDAVGHGVLVLFDPGNRFTRRYRELDADPERARDVDWVSGAAVWLDRDALDEVGGWDEDYFMYVEDVDLCWRLRRAGHRIAYEPAGQVVHVGGLSTGAHPYRMIAVHHRSLYRFAGKRWHGLRRALLPVAGAYLAARAGLAMAQHAASGARPTER